MSESQRSGTFRAFHHRDFRILWSGAFVSNIGTWLQGLAIPFVLFQITGSALWVGIAALAQFVPYFALSPLGGWLADHTSRRNTLRFTQSASAVAAVALWLMWIGGVRQPLVLISFLVIGGALNGINLPNWQAFASDLVPRQDLHSAITLNSVQFNAARAIGPGLAGLTLATLGASWAFALNAASFAFVILALFLVRTKGAPLGKQESRGIVREFLLAARYTITQPNLVVVIVVTTLVAVLGNPVFSFTVVFAGDVYGVGPFPLGMMNVAMGVGAIIAVPIVSGWPVAISLSRSVFWGLCLMSSMLVLFGAWPSYVVGIFSLTLIGGAFLAIISSVNTSLQLRVATQYRGRVMALRMMAFTLGTGIGSFLQGALADIIGPRAVMVTVGLILALATATLSMVHGRYGMRTLDAPTGEGSLHGLE